MHPASSFPASPRSNNPVRIAISAAALLLAALFVLVNRHDISKTTHAAHHAQPQFLLLAAGLGVLYLLAYSLLLQTAERAAGVRIRWPRSLILGPAVHFSNVAVPNSAGLGGMALVVAEARRGRLPTAPAVTGYLVAAQLGHLAFAVLLAAALGLAMLEGQLTVLELVAAAVFGLYTVATLGLAGFALRSERAFLWLHSLPGRVKRTLLRRSLQPVDADAARELQRSIRALVARPRAFALPVVLAFAIEAIGVLTLWTTLAAFVGPTALVVPLFGYAFGVLFSTVGFLPGGLGFAEAGVGLALAQAGIDRPTTALVVVVYRLFEMWLPFALGAVAIQLLPATATPAARAWPGLAGRVRRRFVAGAIGLVAVLNIVLAARRHPLIALGPIHERLPMGAAQSSRYALLAAGVALVATIPGLLHGKRQAWRIAVAALVLGLVAHPFKHIDYAGIGLDAAALVLLIACAASFPARSDPARARQGLAWLVFGELGVLIYGVAGLFFLDRHFATQTTVAGSLVEGVRLLFVLPTSTIEPITRHGSWFIDSVRVSAIAILLISTYHVLHPVIHRAVGGRQERARVQQILGAHGQTSLAWFHLQPDKSYFFASEGDAFVGYRVVGHAAVALGEPVGEPVARRRVAREFAEFCDLNGWSFCFYQVTEAGASELREEGLRSLKVGEDAVIDLQSFALTGKSFKHLRNTVNRLERDGFKFEVLRPPLQTPVVDELEAVSRAWLAEGGHRERAFSLGQFTRPSIGDCEVCVVRAPDGRIEAFANLVPSYRSPDGNFDLMRRRPDSTDGVVDYLFVRLIALFRERGYRGMDLGLAPLANIEGAGVVPTALRLLYEHGGRTFNFKGLRAFKEKWKPEWQPRYLAYRSDLQLPALALAVVRAGEVSGRLPIGGRRARPGSVSLAAPVEP